VVVPLRPKRTVSECLDFARAVSEAIARTDPRSYTTAFAKAGREGKILVDYLRNNRTNTSVCAFSPRARPGAAVSMPLDWDELDEPVAAGDPSAPELCHAAGRCSRTALNVHQLFQT
jgi:bifunctional non-homologous end joining protein LigD